MRTLFTTTAAITALAATVPTLGAAEELGVNAGFAIVSEYVSQGLQFSDGFAVQPYVELSYGGFYAGVWATNVAEETVFADAEVDYYIGYRNEVGKFYYDVGIAYYTFPDQTFPDFDPVDYEEFLLSAGYAATLQLYLTANVGIVPEYDQTDLRLDIDYYTNTPGLTLAASIGTVDTNYGDWSYWSLGGAYTLADNVTLDLTYHDSDATAAVGTSTDGMIVSTISFDF